MKDFSGALRQFHNPGRISDNAQHARKRGQLAKDFNVGSDFLLAYDDLLHHVKVVLSWLRLDSKTCKEECGAHSHGRLQLQDGSMCRDAKSTSSLQTGDH